MRHLIGILLAIGLAVALFFAGTWGYLQLAAPAGHGSLLADHTALAAFIAVAGTGLLAGILVGVPRVSPLAAGLPGLLLLGLTAEYLISVHRGIDLIPLRSYTAGAGLAAMLARGLLGAAGLVLIIPVFVPSRWRGRRRADEPAVAEASEFVSSLTETAGAPAAAQEADHPEPEPEPAAWSTGYPGVQVHHGEPPSGRQRPYLPQ